MWSVQTNFNTPYLSIIAHIASQRIGLGRLHEQFWSTSHFSLWPRFFHIQNIKLKIRKQKSKPTYLYWKFQLPTLPNSTPPMSSCFITTPFSRASREKPKFELSSTFSNVKLIWICSLYSHYFFLQLSGKLALIFRTVSLEKIMSSLNLLMTIYNKLTRTDVYQLIQLI